MKNLSEKLFEPVEGETEAQHAERVEKVIGLFRRVLGTEDGKDLLTLLAIASPPLAPRFYEGETSEMAGFRDGEKHVIAILIQHSGHSLA